MYAAWALLPIAILALAIHFVTNNNKQQLWYSQLLYKFDTNQVRAFTLNLSSGALEWWTEEQVEPDTENGGVKVKQDEKSQKGTVPNVNVFLEDVNERIRTQNIAQIDPETGKEITDPALIYYNYINGTGSSWLLEIIPTVLVGGLVVVFIFLMMRRMNQSIMNENNRSMSFSKARLKQQGKDEKRKTTFDDVAGADEEKEELSEIVEFLRNPQHFGELGARIPKGVLLVGAPGTGKTLLARAVAGEADVPFFSISGSDFVELYVGVGASRVRDMFTQAKKHSPSIVFIDEIDAVGRQRGAGMGGGHDEREQTLNQLLVEMDGFGANEGVIIIAATNRPDILDPALLRPGRFDRQVTVLQPDVRGREAILRVHSRNKPLGPDVDLKVTAQTTAGFTGADLENLLNEAALLAARNKKRAITREEIESAMLKVVVGTEKKSHKKTEKDLRLTAYHEAGHAVAAYYLPSQDPVHQISIISRGMAAGFTMHLPQEDKDSISKTDMEEDIVCLLGGRVAEALVLSDISTGASNDIERATKLAKDMVTRYGMSTALGPVAYASDHDAVFLGRDYSQTRGYSEYMAEHIDLEIKRIIEVAYTRTEKILTDHMEQLHLIASKLREVETMGGDLFATLMTPAPAAG
ncbi:MAG: ATP-dependent zinc metalloprotease FtsH [Oscillospiraceae bacterium]|jgi:cell division protease FtsH|nr:ATP-dependent zinc metalloprotease FtsH [Oscillospiraceae bacterium]